MGEHVFVDAHTKLSYLDTLFLLEIDLRTAYFGLLAYLFSDESLALDSASSNLNFFFYTDYQDFFTIILYHSPELIAVINGFMKSYQQNFGVLPDPHLLFDSFNDTLILSLSEFLDYFILFILFS
jgi:hypothetical protein